MFVRKQS